jgi:hypothetical protein
MTYRGDDLDLRTPGTRGAREGYRGDSLGHAPGNGIANGSSTSGLNGARLRNGNAARV